MTYDTSTVINTLCLSTFPHYFSTFRPHFHIDIISYPLFHTNYPHFIHFSTTLKNGSKLCTFIVDKLSTNPHRHNTLSTFPHYFSTFCPLIHIKRFLVIHFSTRVVHILSTYSHWHKALSTFPHQLSTFYPLFHNHKVVNAIFPHVCG